MKNLFIKKMYTLWKEFLPLSISDVTMAMGDPMVNTALAHMPRTQENFAALGFIKSIVVLFESPIISMLHASNALSDKKESREALWRFLFISCGILTTCLLILAIPPVFYWLTVNLFGISNEISSIAHKMFLCLLLWPSSIAIRRYFQGILIINGKQKTLAHAGFFRFFVLLISLIIGFLLNINSGILAGGSMMIGVLAETIFVILAAQKYRNTFKETKSQNEDIHHLNPKSVKEIWIYYWPLAHSMVLVWGGRALLILFLARAADSSISLAIWPVTWALVLVFANTTRMIQQVIIRNKEKYHPYDFIVFALSVGSILSFFILFLVTSTLGKNTLILFIGQNEILLNGVQKILTICFCIPIFVAMQNVMQGLLMGVGKTKEINFATLSGTAILLMISFLGIYLNFSGAVVAAYSMIISFIIEILILSIKVPWNYYINQYLKQKLI
jgi:Na+-driven multidrug efflux pump